ncbi:hypothetical protein JOD18_001976 [Gracilibacillus alcaliphilus]|nr:hypothetical protein [Gracilibacillus alcaliphilus]
MKQRIMMIRCSYIQGIIHTIIAFFTKNGILDIDNLYKRS